MTLAPTWNGWTVSRTYRAGAPHSGAAPMRRTSVLGRWPKTLTEEEFISPEHCNQKGGAALRAAKPKKKDTPGRVLLLKRVNSFEDTSLVNTQPKSQPSP